MTAASAPPRTPHRETTDVEEYAMTPQDYRRRSNALLAGVEHGAKPVLTISDAEILALDGPRGPRVTPLLSLQRLSESERDRVASQAGRRLMDRGRTEDGTPLGGPDGGADEPTVHTVLRMRRSWLCLLTVDQHSGYGRDFVTASLRADGCALLEVATQPGEHRFTVMTAASALDCILHALTPFAHVDGTEAAGRTYPRATWQGEAMARLSQANVVSAVISYRQDHAMERRAEERLAVYNFEDRTDVLFAEEPDRVRIAPTSRAGLRSRLQRMTEPIDEQSGWVS